jgi:fatty acid/phospholipid biosynthesis enzyme
MKVLKEIRGQPPKRFDVIPLILKILESEDGISTEEIRNRINKQFNNKYGWLMINKYMKELEDDEKVRKEFSSYKNATLWYLS